MWMKSSVRKTINIIAHCTSNMEMLYFSLFVLHRRNKRWEFALWSLPLDFQSNITKWIQRWEIDGIITTDMSSSISFCLTTLIYTMVTCTFMIIVALKQVRHWNLKLQPIPFPCVIYVLELKCYSSKDRSYKSWPLQHKSCVEEQNTLSKKFNRREMS